MPNLGYTSPKFSLSHAKTLFPCRALWLSWGLVWTGLQDLQDRLFLTKQGANNEQDGRMAGFTGLFRRDYKTLKQVRNREDLTEYSSLDDLKQKFK